tara:strand:- start:170 stop:625 length:456 start_codon:yes stop_codon:yes gene_type:complete
METTLVILKPDALKRGLVGKIITRFEEKGLEILSIQMRRLVMDEVIEHYTEHSGKAFLPQLLEFMTSGPVVLMAIRGLGVIKVVRKMIGATEGIQADQGTIRGDYCQYRTYNLVHASDSEESAKRELDLFFKDMRFPQEFNNLNSGFVFGK